MLIDNALGNSRFLRGIGIFSYGVIAHPGYEIVHVAFHPLSPLNKGFELIERHLQRSHRPLNALCGIELRLPQPLSPQGFSEFNQLYVKKLADWNVLVEGVNPVARTNVAPAVNPIPEPSVYGFSYTVPAQHQGTTFVVTGVPEVQFRQDGRLDIIDPGDLSLVGLLQKAEGVLQVLAARLQAMQVHWTDITAMGIYTVRDIHPLLATTILPALQGADRHGIHWHYAWPPLAELELEIDARGVRQEIVIPG